jgi:hypothetical protein
LFAGAIKVTGKFGMFYKTALVEEGGEIFAGDKMVLYAIDFSWSRRACCI